MEWSNDMCLALIDNYEQYPVLWDSKHPYHYSKKIKADAWNSIAENLEIDLVDVRQKMISLLGSFRAQRSKGRKSVGIGKDRKEVYVSKWFAFERMQFLLDKDRPQNSIDTETDPLDSNDAEDFSLDDNAKEIKARPASPDDDFDFTLQNDDSILGQTNFNTLEDTAPTRNNVIAKPPPRKKAKSEKCIHEDSRITDLLATLRDTLARHNTSQTHNSSYSDRFTTYGQHIANKLRTYSSRTQAMVEHAFNNVLFEADMGHYDKVEDCGNCSRSDC